MGIDSIPTANISPTEQSTPPTPTIEAVSYTPTRSAITPAKKINILSKSTPAITPSRCGQIHSGAYTCTVIDGNNRCYYCNNGALIYSDNSKYAGGCPPIQRNCAELNHDTYGCRLVEGNNRCYYCNNGSLIYSDNTQCPGGCQ